MPSEKPEAGPLSFRVRVALTLVLLLLPIAGERIPLPGVDAGAPVLAASSSSVRSVFALGIVPLLSSMIVVECVALFVPKWNAWRHSWPKGRARLDRAAYFLALLFAGFQSFGVVMMLGAPELGDAVSGPTWVVAVTLVAGTGILIAAARAISSLGLLNGVVAIFMVSQLGRFIEALTSASDAYGLLAASVALPLLATWIALKGSEAGYAAAVLAQTAPEKPAQPWISVPASSLHAAAAVPSLLALPATLVAFQIGGAAELAAALAPPNHLPAALVLATLLALLLTWLLQSPEYLSRVLKLPAPDVSRAVRAGLVPTLLLVLVLVLANALALSAGLSAHGASFALLAAMLMDAAAALRMRARDADLVCIREERRPYLVPPLVAELSAHDIDARVFGLNQTSLLRVFAPYMAVELCVPAADAKRARRVVRDFLEGPETPEASAEGAPKPLPPDLRPAMWAASSRIPVLAALAAVALGLLLLDRPAPPPGDHRRQAAVTLEIVRVEDGLNPFAGVDQAQVPPGVALREEHLVLGKGIVERDHYVRIVPQGGETLPDALKRVDAWLRSLALPPGTRLAFGDIEETNEQLGRTEVVAWRSYLLRGPAVVSAADVEDAQLDPGDAQRSASVMLRLGREGSERFRQATGAFIGRRLAILVGGKVQTAPIIQAEIPGPFVQITSHRSDPREALEEARALAASLTGRR